MLIFSCGLSKKDQVIEKYYYYLHSNFFNKYGRNRFFICFFAYMSVSSVYFFLQGKSPFISFVFLPAAIPFYFITPWISWKLSSDVMWKGMYEELRKELYVDKGILIVKSTDSSGFSSSKVIDSGEVYKIILNDVHVVIFFLDEASLFNIFDISGIEGYIEKLKNCCNNAVLMHVKEKTTVL